MPAQRIEESAFTDSRFDDLADFAGLADADHARGKMARLWHQCTLQMRYSLSFATVNRVLGERGVEAIVRACLGEIDGPETVRIKGTQGRIEWIGRLRENGRKGGRPKKKTRNLIRNHGAVPSAKPDGLQNQNPSSSASSSASSSVSVSSSPSVSPSEIGPPQAPPRGGSVLVLESPSGSVKRKTGRASASDLSADEHSAALRVLARLSARNGVRYEGSAKHIRLIAGRLRDGVDEHDLRKVIAYCAYEKGWEDDDKMRDFLRPETLFGPETISRYLDPARAWFDRLPESEKRFAPDGGEP